MRPAAPWRAQPPGKDQAVTPFLRNSLLSIRDDLRRQARRVAARSKKAVLGQQNQEDLSKVAGLLTEASKIFDHALDDV